MGHVINPSAMRIGVFRYWEDIWYKDHLYYPEFLHQIFKMRFFLTSFFGFSFFERKNIFFSHFYFVYQHKSLNIKIFLYLGYVEFFFNNFSLENILNYNILTGKFLKIQQNFVIILLLFLKNFLKTEFNVLYKLYSLLKLLGNHNNRFIKFYLKRVDFKNKKQLIFFLRFFVFNKNNKLESLFELWWILVKYIILIPKFKNIKLFIDNIFNFIFSSTNLNCVILNVSNENLNAKFLARYIAKRLQQGFSIRQVIRPIVKDLLKTNKFSTAGPLSQSENLNNNKLVFKAYLNKYIKLFQYILNTNIWITTEYLNLFFNLKNKFKYSVVIQIFKIYWNNFIYLNYYLNFYVHNYYYLKSYYDKYFENLFKNNYSSKNIFFEQKLFVLNVFLINISFFFLNNFLKLNYLNFCGNDLYYKKKSTKYKNLCMLGFKLHFVGRFSRRQRASSIWFMQGKIPLNTLEANIEFGYYTIPLFNSAVRVKIYINRGLIYNEYWMKIV